MPPFAALASPDEVRRLAIVLSRLTGWSKGDVLALPLNEALLWLHAAREMGSEGTV